MENLNIEVHNTDDPHAKKFQLGATISEREITYTEANGALLSPIAGKIFGFPWAHEVTVGKDFVTVAKQEWVEWEILEEPLGGLINEHFQSYESQPIEENPEPKTSEIPQNLDSPEAKDIQELFTNEINPSLAGHGGFVTLKGFENNKVYIEMGGGCQGCSMSKMTLREGIEGAIRHKVPSVTEIIDVTDHASGDNPFY